MPELPNHAERAKRTMPRLRTKQLDWVASHFDGAERNSDGYMALCPAHDDSQPSLHISLGKDGRVLLHCFAGCAVGAILDLAGLRMGDLAPGAKPRPEPVAKYSYRDADGKVLYQVVRYEPKSFRQRRPKPGGGWAWNVKDVEKVLYRLPELLAADPAEPVFLCEGEKDADRLAELGLVATTYAGGAKAKWTDRYTEALRGRRVVILADNDPAGWDKAKDNARRLREVAAVVLPELPGLAEGSDISDWLDAGGTADRLKALGPEYLPNAPQDNGTAAKPLGHDPTGQRNTQRDGPEPLCRWALCKGQPPTGFPIGVLPGPVGKFVWSVAEAMPCSLDIPACMVLPVLGSAIGRKRSIELKPGWVEYPLLWVAVVARSGDRKTPAFIKVTEPVRARQKRLVAEYAKEKQRWDALEGKESRPPHPVLEQTFTTDTTIEALKDVLAGNPSGILFPADELSGWARSMSQYKGGRGDDRQHWLSIWSGVDIVCNRKGSTPLFIPNPFVGVTGGIQPDALDDVVNHDREDGFAARILFSYPNPIAERDWTEQPVQGTIEYAGVWESLYDLPRVDEPLKLAPAAKARWVAFVNEHRHQEPPDALRPVWSKAEGHCARLALVLHLTRLVCNATKSKAVDKTSLDGAVQLIDYFKSHAQRVYQQAAMAEGKDRLSNAVRWVKRRGGSVTARQVRMYGVNGINNPEGAVELLRDLQEAGYGSVTKEKRGSVVFRLGQAPQDNETTEHQVPLGHRDNETTRQRDD